MPSRIDVQYAVPDARAGVLLGRLRELGFERKIQAVHIIDSYILDARLSLKELQRVRNALTNHLIERSSLNRPLAPKRFNWAIEIGFLPGVTDNVATTVQETAEDLLKRKFKPSERAYSARVFFISCSPRRSSAQAGKLTEKDAAKIAASLYNPLIERAKIKSFKEFEKDGGMGTTVPKVALGTMAPATLVNLKVSDNELQTIGREGIENSDGSRRGPLALDMASMKTIQAHFARLGRKPTDIELESIAQTWSEHCKHTIFSGSIDNIHEGIYRKYIKGATQVIRAKKGSRDFCVSVFTDNSGGVAFDDDYLVTHKVETHNAPSALDPFGGAITGIGGVNRDAMGFGMGAKPVANIYGFCFGNPRDMRQLYRGAGRTSPLLSPQRIMRGVIQGINVGGNCSGIPTPSGFIFFDDSFRGRPLVFAGTVGLIPRRVRGKFSHVKRARPGDYIVIIGGRTGQDGIHGVTFASVALDSGSPATAVQIGDPITQKKLSDMLTKEARDRGWYTSITDDGGGGLSCSVAEMARECGGAFVDLEKVPLKYPNLEPWKIWVSESQERMTLSVPKKHWRELRDLCARRGVEATVIGTFTNSGRCVVRYRQKTIMDLSLEFLHNGLPKKRLKTEVPKKLASAPLPRSTNIRADLLKLLSRMSVGSYEAISMQYDHEVQGGSVLKPLQGRGRVNADATVFRPRLDSSRGVALSYGLYPAYSDLDPYKMAATSIDTAVRSLVAAGAPPDSIALLDNFCWSSSNDPKRLWQLKRAAEACYDYAVSYETPFISGKDSMFNDFNGFDENGAPIKISAKPTLLISGLAVTPDVLKTVSIDLKAPGDVLYLLGETRDELGGSEYARMIFEGLRKYEHVRKYENMGGAVPNVNAPKNKKLYAAFSKCVQENLVTSSIALTRGGLGIALAKTAIAGGLGVSVSLKSVSSSALRDDVALFSESQGRILVSVRPEARKRFEELMTGNACRVIGSVTRNSVFEIRGVKNTPIVRTNLKTLTRAYRLTLTQY